MTLNIRINGKLSINLGKCPHLLVFGRMAGRYITPKSLKERIRDANNDKCNTVCDIWNDAIEKRLNERYELLNGLNLRDIEQVNERYGQDYMKYSIVCVTSLKEVKEVDQLKQVLMKGRAVGIHVIMFADSINDFGNDINLLDMFVAKLVCRTIAADESERIIGCKGAEKLNDKEFMFVELGKRPVIYDGETM